MTRDFAIRSTMSLLIALITCSSCQTTFGQTAADNVSPDPLVTRQKMIRDRLGRLTDRMFSLHQKLSAADPESAARLAAGLERLGELDIRGQVEELIGLLGRPGLLEQAGDRQQHLLGDLQALLAALAEPVTDAEALKKERQRLRAISKELGRILDEERREQLETRQAAARAHAARLLQAAIEQAQALAERQSELLEQTTHPPSGSDGSSSKQAASQQQELADQTKRLAEELPSLDDGAESPTETTEGLESASESMEAAAGSMGKAASALKAETPSEESAEPPTDAAEKQKEALEELRRAIHRLEQARDALRQDTDGRQQAKDQRDLTDQTKSLEQRMDQAPRPPEGRKQQTDPDKPQEGNKPGQGPQSSGQSQSGKPSAGSQALERAKQHMERAAEELDDGDLGEGADEQQEAVDALEQAKEDVDDALRQLREKEREELLSDLQSRLLTMLQQQLAVNGSTYDLDEIGLANFTRAEDLLLAELVTSQREVASAADACLRILEEDGTSVVLPRMLQRAAVDMRSVADRLTKSDVGPLTQLVQEHIAATLADLVEAVQQQRDDMAEGEGGSSPPGDEDAPLLPTSAELKMLRAAQVRLHQRTQAVAEAVDARSDLTGDGKIALSFILREIASHQAELAAAAREMRDQAEGR